MEQPAAPPALDAGCGGEAADTACRPRKPEPDGSPFAVVAAADAAASVSSSGSSAKMAAAADFVSPFASSFAQHATSGSPVQPDSPLPQPSHTSRSGSPVRVVGFQSSPNSVVAPRRWQSAAVPGTAEAREAAAAMDAAIAAASGSSGASGASFAQQQRPSLTSLDRKVGAGMCWQHPQAGIPWPDPGAAPCFPPGRTGLKRLNLPPSRLLPLAHGPSPSLHTDSPLPAGLTGHPAAPAGPAEQRAAAADGHQHRPPAHPSKVTGAPSALHCLAARLPWGLCFTRPAGVCGDGRGCAAVTKCARPPPI